MGLMTATGPLGLHPAGKFNFEPPPPGRALYLEPTAKRIRVVVEDEVVADSYGVMMLHESGSQPVYYFPPDDVRHDLFEASDTSTYCPKKGEASYYSVRVGERIVPDAAWFYPEPIAGAPPIGGLIAFYWERVDHWLEEEEEVFFHPRDPYHRIDILPSSRQVRVLRKGTVLAESARAMVLFETGRRRAGISRARTSSPSSGPAIPIPDARTRAGRATSRWSSRAALSMTSSGRTPLRAPKRSRSLACSRSMTNASTSSSTASRRSAPNRRGARTTRHPRA
ncbi:MAG TPA: DUF427 domain-containing protein [Solirubrobacteraceae bacterium]|nr:DUF427 domain-containing protein [Solirubrobacteraceae bacterium]